MSRIFDAHAHAFPDPVAAPAIRTLVAAARWWPVRASHDGTVAGLLASMDHAGIDRAIVCGVATKPTQVTRITDWCAAIASDRLVPFASVHPDYPDPEAEMARIASLGLRGVKFHPQYMRCAIDDPRTLRIARAAADAGLAMTLHAGHDLGFEKDESAAPAKVRRLHKAVPHLRLLACHLGGWEQWAEVVEHLLGLPIWLETSFCLGQCPPPLLQRILAGHPQEYLLFGTDSPWADQSAELAAFNATPMDASRRQAALWDNALRLIGED